MTSISTICYYAMYVIGEVESQWSWTAINYNDPITIGMMQWYGTRAASLLNRVKNEQPDFYASLAASLRTSLESYSDTNAYWNSRYLTLTEGNSIVSIFQNKETHIMQEEQAISDFEGYITTLESWGMSSTNPKPLIFAMSMYHQNPSICGQIIASAGGSADLDKLYTTCLNQAVFGQYSNRYTTIYNRLKSWDGESAPPDFGQVGEVGSGGNNPGVGTEPSKMVYIIQRGNVLVLYGRDEYKNGVVFYPAGIQKWVNGYNADGTEIGGGNTGGGDDKSGQAIIDYAKSVIGKWAYGNGAGRLSPETSGYTDCSGFVWWCYHHVAGIDLGTWTGTQSQDGTEIWRGASLNDIPWATIKPGDILLMTATPGYLWNFDGYMCDAQLCTGNANETIAASYGNVPRLLQGASIDVYNGSVGFMIRRIL